MRSGILMTIVAFAEKDKAAEQIAHILSGGKKNKTTVRGLPVYSFNRNGDQWMVMGLAGHIMNYDFTGNLNDWKSIEPKLLISTMPQKLITKANYASAVQDLAAKASMVILACDFDREGENIGFEVKLLAERVCKAPIKRAKYSSFTQKEIEFAFTNLQEPDMNVAMAAEVRQILDLKMGAAFTRYITMAVQDKVYRKGVLSIGPCQTPTCGFVYDREKKIRDFVPADFWKITAIFDGNSTDFEGIHRKGNIKDPLVAEEIYRKIYTEKKAIVTEKKVTDEKREPPLPFNTNEFLKSASKYLNVSPEDALEIAEQLYLAGFISYPRTETNKYADDFDFNTIVMDMVNISSYQKSALVVLSKKPITCRNGNKDAHDHPPIHPVKAAEEKDISRTIGLKNAFIIYDLIVRNFLANLMDPAVMEKTRLVLTIKDEPFDASGTVKKYNGWTEIYPYGIKGDKLLPVLTIGQIVDVKKISNIKDKTKPPGQLTEAELLTLMDKHGIGTKATAPTHIQTNKIRGYFQVKGKSVSILDTGYTLMDGLNNSVPIVVKPEVRARIEKLIQEVEDGKKSKDTAIKEGVDLLLLMYFQLESHKDKLVGELIGTIHDEREVADKKSVVGVCPDCNKALVLKKTDKGRFVSCSGYPSCKRTYPVPKTGTLVVEKGKKCKKDGCGIFNVDKKYYWSIGIGPCFNCDLQKECHPPEAIGDCPKCSGKLILVNFKDKMFIGCTTRCGYTQPVPAGKKITISAKVCPECGWKLLHLSDKEKGTWDICINRSCSNNGKKINEKKKKELN